jgi:hypothetical protein
MVTGANGIAIGKQNGIWSVQLNTNSLATSTPPTAAFANDYVVVFDSTTGLYSKVALNVISAGGMTSAGGIPGQIQYNNAGALGGFTMSGDATVNTGTGAITIPVFQASGVSHAKGEVPDPGAVAGTTRFLREDASWTAPPVLPKQLAGLTLANDATTPATVLDIDVGSACSDDNTTMIVLTTALTKNCNAAWAVGSGNGALDSGSALAASTWYHVYLIERTDTGVIDVLVSTNATTPTMPTNYTKKRRIGSIKTDASSHILAFSQLGDQFLWVAPVTDQNNVAINTGALQAFTISVPIGLKVIAYCTGMLTAPATTLVTIQSLDQPAGGAGQPPGNVSICIQVASAFVGADFNIRTNIIAQIGATANGVLASGFYIVSKGWTDNRGK